MSRKLVSRLGLSLLLFVGLLLLVIQVVAVSRGMTDFCQDYLAAQNVLRAQSPYLPIRCWVGVPAVHLPISIEYDSHPPPSVLLFLPLALLSRLDATLIWGCCCLAAYLAAGWLLLKTVGWSSLAGVAVFVLFSAIWPPLRSAEAELNYDQVMLLLLVAAWLLERKGHSRWAGVLIGLAGLLKLWPAALLLGAGIDRRWKLVSAGALTLFGGTLLTLLALGAPAYGAYLGPVQANYRALVPSELNLSLVGVITRSLAGYRGPPYVLPAVFGGLSLGEAVWLGEAIAGLFLIGTLLLLWWCGRHEKSEAGKLLGSGLLVTGLLLVFPAVWYASMILLLLPCTTLLLALRQLPRPPRWWLLALEGCLLLLFGGAWLIPQHTLQGPATNLTGWETGLFALPTGALLLFAGLQAWLLLQVGNRAVTNGRLACDQAEETINSCYQPAQIDL